ncbi:PEP-utilizing enzyme [Vibrio coralliirubri]|uniref:PEP-utilizing enzyme n=1 Tax=Vibrio coralliirubri TaxID=1516159 RepID=UPI000EFBC90F|nr:PEP-utilizing enzyme [Vibrio coralliirubri]
MGVELYFLGAGKPASGNKPAALKNIANNTKAMDWQLHSFEELAQPNNTYFLGGYHVEDIVKEYPELNFSIIPEWENSTALDTLLHAPFSGKPVVISYTDTLFRKDFISSLASDDSDVTVVIDSYWRERYSNRSREDIVKAETLTFEGNEVEFTGLVYLSSKAVSLLQKAIDEGSAQSIGHQLLDIIAFYESKNSSVTFKDIEGDWAEFNSPTDIANFILGTKADTLARLEPVVMKSHIGKQESFTTKQWLEDSNQVISNIQAQFGQTKLVVRSSSKAEDNWRSSNAGGFESILNVTCMNDVELTKAIQDVVSSYGYPVVGSDQVLVQEFLKDVAMAGVVFTCTLESGAPYYRFNFDDSTQSTESVTAGTHSDLRTVLVSKLQPHSIKQVAPELSDVLAAVQELETLLSFDKLDIEFAVDTSGQVHVFQVRPVVVNHDNYDIDVEKVASSIISDVSRYQELQNSLPFIYGKKTIFANMPDWNPAEIISTRPKPLAFSLYQQLITNEVWATQRAEYGYRDVRPYPLIVSFSGQPYVDVRASFNSFIPVSVPSESADRIVNAYLSILSENPHFHDKIEFDVVFTIWTPDFLETAKSRLMPYGVTEKDIAELEAGLKLVTRNALTRLSTDIESIQALSERCEQVCSGQLRTIDRIFALLDDCRRFGTLAFSHAARAGFVAATLMKSLVNQKVLLEARRMQFLNSFDTVAGEFEQDKSNYLIGLVTEGELVKKYGHLRPGTYEVTTQAYWEDPKQFLLPKEHKEDLSRDEFIFNDSELTAIKELLIALGSDVNENEFIQYLIRATQERERVKFEFTRNLSQALDLCVELGKQFSLTREDVSFMTYGDIERLKLNMSDVDTLRVSLNSRKEKYQLTKVIELPPLIDSPAQFYSFERHSSQPNFIGVDRVLTDITKIEGVEPEQLSGKIVMIPQADPGYDWLFGYDIEGLITQYGGANSHMAIRSAEIGLPAAIGVGEKLYDSLLTAKRVELDCPGQILRVIE